MITTQIKVSVKKLIDILKENKKKHIETHAKALEGFKIEYKERLEAMLSNGKYELNIGLTEPKRHDHEYDSLIRVLEMETEPVTEIASYELAKIMDDQWDWKRAFDSINSLYLAKVGR